MLKNKICFLSFPTHVNNRSFSKFLFSRGRPFMLWSSRPARIIYSFSCLYGQQKMLRSIYHARFKESLELHEIPLFFQNKGY